MAENSVFTRRLAENVVVDPTAKHTCKVDIFRTDISDVATSILSVKFYGTSLLAAYDAEIGSLPNGIDVRFEKNNDYLYNFRGKETTLELIVNKQDNSLSGDFTIPIIFTHKSKEESSVICQLNLINEEAQTSAPHIIPVEPIRDPSQEFMIQFLEDIQTTPLPDTPEELIESLIPQSPIEETSIPVTEDANSIPLQESISTTEDTAPVTTVIDVPDISPDIVPVDTDLPEIIPPPQSLPQDTTVPLIPETSITDSVLPVDVLDPQPIIVDPLTSSDVSST